WWFARFVADTYGVDALRRLYLLACGPDHPDLTAAVRGALGIEMSELQGAWAGWLESLATPPRTGAERPHDGFGVPVPGRRAK
ncbi:MAG: hypothetical protein EBU23_03785, partial [Mycobacteriaceae bacterium]|nr:hypothetical protein [Mycobacteriaceae bacterium]